MTNCSVSILKKLVSFDTTSRNSNLDLIEWAANLLGEHGARLELIHSERKDKANLLASLGPKRPGGVVLSGHTDVVPADDQEWASDPFVLTERDGRLYGRGTSDMKGFIACCLAAAAGWSRLELRRPLHIALSYDEEVGCLGAPSLVEQILRNDARPAFAIIGEPTGMKIGLSHNGVTGSQTTFRGTTAHASDPSLGVNAINAAAEFVRFLDQTAKLPQLTANGSTFNVGRIHGGSVTNSVAERCSIWWEFRPANAGDEEAVEAMITEYLGSGVFSALGVDHERELCVPQFNSDFDAAAIHIIERFGGRLPTCKVPFGSEAGIFERQRIPAVICGPGSIEQAHRPDEWIQRASIEEADRFLENVGSWASHER